MRYSSRRQMPHIQVIAYHLFFHLILFQKRCFGF
jgi:hypothetical protein